MKSHLRAGAVDDAVLVGDNFGLDGVDEKSFLWGFFDAPDRAAMKKAQERMRAERKATPITEPQRIRLEARISELKIDRESVKAKCMDLWGVEHFASLSKLNYDVLDGLLDDWPADHTTSTAPTQPAASTPAGQVSEKTIEARKRAADAYSAASAAVKAKFDKKNAAGKPIDQMSEESALRAHDFLSSAIDAEAAQ